MEENIEAGASETADAATTEPTTEPIAEPAAESTTEAAAVPVAAVRHRRQEKVGLVVSDKMQKSVVVRVERQVQHRKYRRYIRRRTRFMAHDEIGAHTGDIVRIVETRPLSARKRWRVVEIVQKAR